MKKLAGIFLLFCLAVPSRAEPISQPVLERYEQMLLKTPEPGIAFDKVYQHYVETDGLENLATRWKAELGKNPPNRADYLLLLGLLNERRGKVGDALKNLTEAAETAPGWRMWSALAAVQVRAGKLAEAVDSYKKALSLEPPKDALGKLYRGLALCQQRLLDQAGAVETWQSYAKASPGDVFVLEEAGDALVDAGRYDEAWAMFVQIREQKEADPAQRLNASLRLAEVERQRGHKKEALKIYNEALAEAGKASWLQKEVREKIERLFRADDDLPGLAKYYQERLKAEPADIEASLRLSDTFLELNRADDSLAILQNAVGQAPDNKELKTKLAAGLVKAERPAEAEAVLAALAKAFPEDSGITEKLGDAQWASFKLGTGSQEAARETWKKLAGEGADAGLIYRLAEIYRAHDLTEDALAEYRRALALDPAASDRRERLAEYLAALDRKAEGMKELEGLVADDRATGENYLRLARIQRRFGDDGAASRSLETADKLPDRVFDRRLLRWQIASDADQWADAELLAGQLRESASSEPEIERADDCLVQSLGHQDKYNSEIRQLLDRQKSSPDTFSERDYRLLFVLALEADDDGSAAFALDEGLKRFPKSASLSKLENTYARRGNDPARRLAALARLEELEPQRAGDWLAERVRVCRDTENWEEAIKLARQCVQQSPARVDAHLLLADILLGAQQPAEAIIALKEAARLSDNPNQVRLRLVELLLAQGQVSEAREAMDQAFEAEESNAGKLQLMNRLAGVYLREGKIDELIAKFRQRQKAEQGGWRYALYLAEVYQMMQDNVRAMEELDKALAGKPDDPILLRRLMSMAESTGDTDAVLKYARKVAEADPSPQNRAQLAVALANEGQLDEVLQLIKENSEEFLDDPSAWQDAVRPLQFEGRTSELAALLEGRLRSSPDDFEALLTLAEILMGSGQRDKAPAALWRILEIREDPAAQPQPTPGAQPPTLPPARAVGVVIFGGGISGRTGTAVSPSQSRAARFGETFQRATQILSGNPENAPSYRSRRARGGSAGIPSGGPTLSAAQDDAIVYLACLAIRDGKEIEFVNRLGQVLKDRPPADRFTIASLLQSPDMMVSEVEAWLNAGEKDPKFAELGYQSLQTIVANRRGNPSLATESLSDEKLKALMDNLSARFGREITPQNAVQRYQILAAQGKQGEADDLARQILDTDDKGVLPAMAMKLQIALIRKDYDKAIAINERMNAVRQKSGAGSRGFGGLGLAITLLGSEAYRTKCIDLMAGEFLAPGPAGSRPGFNPAGRSLTWSQIRESNVASLIPFPTRDLNEQQLQMLRTIGSEHPQFKTFAPAIIKRFGELAEEKDSPSLRQATAWLLWFSGKHKEAVEAIKSLVEKQPSDELVLNYALMLANAKQSAEALKALNQMAGRGGDAFELACRLRFVLALDLKDEAAARAAALTLASMRLVDYEQSQLAEEMKRLGLEDEAEKMQKKIAAPRNPMQRSRQMSEVMNERAETGDREEALTLAQAILGRDPFSRSAQNERYQEEQALRTLKKFGALDEYIEKLRIRLDAAPQSARLNAQIAQAVQIKDPKLAEPYYRKLVDLRPRDSQLVQQLANILLASKQDEEAMRLFDRVLAEDPAILFSRGTNFIEPYRRTQSWQRLADAIAKSPDPDPDPLNPNRQNYAHVFSELGRELQRVRPPVDSTAIWYKGLRWDGSGGWQLRPILAQSLARTGRNDEAKKVIEEAFFPPGGDRASARVYVYNRQFRPNAIWSQLVFRGQGEADSPALRLLRLAAEIGCLKDLLPKMEKVPQSAEGNDPATLARIILRDESVLPGIRKEIEEAKAVKPGSQPRSRMGNVNNWLLLAGELEEWPAGREVSLEALEAAAQMNRLQGGNDYGTQMAIHSRRAELALQIGKPEQAKKALLDWKKAQDDWQRQGAQFDPDVGLKTMRMMASLGMEKEVADLAGQLRANPNFNQNSYGRRMLAQLENEIAILLGKKGAVGATLAWIPAAEGGSLLWSLKPDSGGEEDGNESVWVSSEPLPKTAGKYTLEIYFGESRNALKRIANMPAVPARGVWKGKLPKPGYVRAFVRNGDEVVVGPAVRVADGKILLDPGCLEEVARAKNGTARGWAAVPPISASLEKGDPSGAGNFLRLEADQGNTTELVGERIPIDPKKRYLAGCWLRFDPGAGGAQIGWRVYDRNGKELNRYSPSGNYQEGRWNYCTMAIGRGDDAQSLPPTAAWLEPFVEFNGKCDLSGMFLVETDSPPEEE